MAQLNIICLSGHRPSSQASGKQHKHQLTFPPNIFTPYALWSTEDMLYLLFPIFLYPHYLDKTLCLYLVGRKCHQLGVINL